MKKIREYNTVFLILIVTVFIKLRHGESQKGERKREDRYISIVINLLTSDNKPFYIHFYQMEPQDLGMKGVI